MNGNTIQRRAGGRQAGGWIQTVEDLGVVAVAEALGLTVGRSGSALWISPCPVCNQPHRHRKRGDRRGAVGVTHDGGGWRCHQCDASGGAVALAAAVLAGDAKIPGGDPRWREVRELLEACGVIGPNGATPRTMVEGAGGAEGRSPVLAHPREPIDLPRAPAAELWAMCAPVTSDPEVCAYLERRRVDPDRAELRGLARAWPLDAEHPAAVCNRIPWARRWRLVVPLYGPAGSMLGIQARALDDLKDKSANAGGGSLAELAFADPLARLWLAGAALGDGSPAAQEVARVGLVIAEGLSDFLTWATARSDADSDAPAVLGIVSGTWGDAWAAQIPDGCRVTIATHHDKPDPKRPDAPPQGDAYAAAIVQSLAPRARAGRVTLTRWEQ